MEHHRLENMTGGWFVGDFLPAAYTADVCEVAVKTYLAGETEAKHFHKVASEITLILSGSVRMMNREFTAGDIIVLAPGEATAFEALTDAVNVVVKVPSVRGDKYVSEG